MSHQGSAVASERGARAPSAATDPEAALVIEREIAAWIGAHEVIPGAEVHRDPDVTWVVQPGHAWGNTGTMIRFTAESAPHRLDDLIRRYRANGRGMGLWVAPAATPADLGRFLRERRLNCRKHFPVMMRSLARLMPLTRNVDGLEIRQVDDASEFLRHPHPSLGPITTPYRRYALEGMRAKIARRPRVTWPFVAWLDGRIVASSLLFMGPECAGLHDMTVLPSHRGRGIGAVLLEHTCAEAARRGATTMVLQSTTEGERLYRARGFAYVARFAYWYRRLA